jgi:hypothetical protein
MRLSSFWFTGLLPQKGAKGARDFSFCVFCAFLRPFSGGAGAGLLNKETRNAGEEPVHGFKGFLVESKGGGVGAGVLSFNRERHEPGES